jgi:hypothetical protein
MNLNYRKLLPYCAVCLVGVAAGCWAPPALAQTVTFDFDSGSPAPTLGTTIPFNYDSGGVTASFDSPTNNAFSVQDPNGVPGTETLSLFSGQFLCPNSIDRAPLSIKLSHGATNISLVFATAQSTAVEIPNPITVTAYLDSASNPVGSPVTVSGVWRVGSVTEAYPSAALTFSSDAQHPFNLIEVVMEPGGAGGIMLDNIAVQLLSGIQYTITTSASPPAGGSTSGDGSYAIGTNVTVVATPNPGYEFVNWTQAGVEVSTLATYDFTAAADLTLVANFVRMHTVTTSASPGNGGTTSGDGSYPDGSGGSVLANASPGFVFVNWTEYGVPVSTWPGYAFTVTTNRILVANFAATCTVTTSSASATAGCTCGGGAYAIGSTINVVATPTTGQAFVNWTENGMPVSTLASFSFIGSTNRTLVANFAPNVQSVTFDFDTGTPALTNSQFTSFDQTAGGLTANFSATNDPAFSVQSEASTGWILSKFSTNCLAPNTSPSVLDIQFSQPITNISLTFATFDFQDVLAPSTIELEAYATSTASPPLGTTAAQGIYTPGDSMPMGTLTFGSTTAFNVVRILLPPTPTGATDFMVDNVTVQLSGATSYSITTSSSPPVGGSTSGGGSYTNGATVTLTAAANPGYAFVNWTENGSPVGSSLSLIFTASADRTLVANFVQTWAIAASANPAAAGLITGAATYTNNASVTLTATANPGYAFVNWTENGSPVGSSLSLTFTASADRTLVANFLPTLQISLTSTNTVLVSWAAASPGYVLQENSALVPANWVDTTNRIDIIGGQNHVVATPSAGNRFFRLYRP